MLGLGLPQQAGHEPAVAATLKGCCGDDAANIQQTEKGASPCLLWPCRPAAVFPIGRNQEYRLQSPKKGLTRQNLRGGLGSERWYKSKSKTNLLSVTKLSSAIICDCCEYNVVSSPRAMNWNTKTGRCGIIGKQFMMEGFIAFRLSEIDLTR